MVLAQIRCRILCDQRRGRLGRIQHFLSLPVFEPSSSRSQDRILTLEVSARAFESNRVRAMAACQTQQLQRYIMGGTILAPVGLVATETSAVPATQKSQMWKCGILHFAFARNALRVLGIARSLQMSPDYTGSPFYPKALGTDGSLCDLLGVRSILCLCT